MRIIVWTLASSPFRLGGPSMSPVSCEVEADGPHDLGAGFSGYLVTAPNGKTFVAEASSGAFVGPTIEAVRADVSAASPAVMKKQVEGAVYASKDATRWDEKRFWSALKCN